MTTLTPHCEAKSSNRLLTSNNPTVAELQYSFRRRISSSLSSWEKENYNRIITQTQRAEEEPVNDGENAKNLNTSLRANTLKSNDDSDHQNGLEEQMSDARDDVEHDQNQRSDVLSKSEGLTIANASNGTDSSVSGSNPPRRNRFNMAFLYSRKALCILGLILTTYASIPHSLPKVSKAPPPSPFFPQGSLVHDWPSGVLGPTHTRVYQSELSFVFYYAPWCAESRHARKAFEHVARFYYKEAHFAAINCWQPGGECRTQYSKVQSWPVLMAYRPNGVAIQYHQAWTKLALTRFIQSLITPLVRLTDPSDLMNLMSEKDAVVVGFVDLLGDRKLYYRFYNIALKWLEKDPFQEVAFGVVTGQSSRAFGVDEVPTIRLYLWNDTIEYNGNDTWATNEVISWVNKRIHVVSMWITPPGATKSTSLAPYFKQGPVLFLFTPRPLYGGSSDAYMMLRQLGMQYYNCRNDVWVEAIAKTYISEQRRMNADAYWRLKKDCELLLSRHPQHCDRNDRSNADGVQSTVCRATDGRSAIAISFVNVLNSSKFADGGRSKLNEADNEANYCEVESELDCADDLYECGIVSETDTLDIMQRERCLKRKTKRRSSFFQTNKQNKLHPTISMLNSEHDYRGPKLLRKQQLRRQCELQRLSERENDVIFYEEPINTNNTYLDLIKGTFCKFNKTLTFLAMDSSMYHAFAERLGVDVLSESKKSMAVIVDSEDESTYVRRESLNLEALAELVHGYYNRTHSRFLRSNNVSFRNTHSFTLHELRKGHRQQQKQSSKKVKQSVRKSSEYSNQMRQTDDEYHFVREINSQNFNQVVVETNQTVVVHFYSAQCAFCGMLSQHLLTISRLLQTQPWLSFVRIDGDKNDLKWEYTMDTFPTLIIFPKNRKSESRIFSRELQLTVPNLLAFILSNLHPAERIHAHCHICEHLRPSSSSEDCLIALKRELSDGIAINLRLYRKSSARPRFAARMLDRLQTLQEFYFYTLHCLSHSCDYSKLKEHAKTILRIWPSEA